KMRLLLGAIGVLCAILAYTYYVSKHAGIPDEEHNAPGLGKLWEVFKKVTTEHKSTESIWLYDDTKASLKIFGKAMLVGVGFATLIGVAMGVFSTVNALLSPIVTAIAKVPPTALLAVFFVLFHTGDTAKVAIIVAGIAPTLANGIVMCAKA